MANRIAILAAREGWCVEYVRATYDNWFQNDLVAGDEPNLDKSLNALVNLARASCNWKFQIRLEKATNSVDVGAPTGTLIFAPADTVVEETSELHDNNSAYGKVVVIKLNNDVRALRASGHLPSQSRAEKQAR